MPNPLAFRVIRTDPDCHARLGRLDSLHGSADTPAFMPVGTQGTLKGLLPQIVWDAGARIVLGNTYHLMLRPGSARIRALGGLHSFMGWDGMILTDSGGFQVFSLGDLREISDEGVVFKSHIDGSMHQLTPAKSIAVQNDLGADIIMVFDECAPGDADRDTHIRAMRRTLDWAQRSRDAHARPGEQSLFAIVQGGSFLDLRAECAEKLASMDFPGYALGGLAVGEGFDAMVQVLRHTTPLLPQAKPRYLMGVGYPRDIVEAVAAGVDMFDCVLPTRNGRNANAFTARGQFRLRNARFADDPGPIEPGCDCIACAKFSRAAIRHYFMAGEMLGPILVSAHNTRFYQRLMADIRSSIGSGTFARFREDDPRSRLGPGIGQDDPHGEVEPNSQTIK